MLHRQQCFSKLPKIEKNCGALPYAKLCTAIYQIGRSIGAKKLANADILLFRFIFFGPETFLTSTFGLLCYAIFQDNPYNESLRRAKTSKSPPE